MKIQIKLLYYVNMKWSYKGYVRSQKIDQPLLQIKISYKIWKNIKKRLEEEKLNAINQLEVRSQEFAKEKEEKERLMARIKMLTSQVLVGGKHIEETPQFKSALEERQRAIRQEYE